MREPLARKYPHQPGVPFGIAAGIFQGVLLLSLLACDTLVQYRLRWSRAP